METAEEKRSLKALSRCLIISGWSLTAFMGVSTSIICVVLFIELKYTLSEYILFQKISLKVIVSPQESLKTERSFSAAFVIIRLSGKGIVFFSENSKREVYIRSNTYFLKNSTF